VEEATEAIRQQPIAHLDENGGSIGNTEGYSPAGRRGWLWLINTPALPVLSRAYAARPLRHGNCWALALTASWFPID
jgi:hypothetical protein